MGRASGIQHGFNAGEWSPLLLGRQDLEKYPRAMATCLNALPLTQGAWIRRSGTAFEHQAKFHSKVCRVLPFQYSVDQTYTLEFGDLYVRFHTSHAVLTKAVQNITAISKANPAVLTYSGADTYANTERVVITGVVGMTQVNNREFVVTNVNAGANTFELYDSDGNAVSSTAYSTYVSGGTVGEVLEVVTPYAEADLAELRITQSADTLYLTHPDYAPRTLIRNSALSWTLNTLTLIDGPYDSQNATATTLTPGSSAPGTGVTLTASAVTGINSGQGFLTTDVGRLIRIREGAVWGYVLITAWTSTTVVTVTIINTLTNTNAKTAWRMGAFSGTTGYPAVSTFHEDRLWFAGAALFPQRLDGSKSGLYTDFTPSLPADGTVADDNAVSYTLNSDDVNAVRWLASNEKGLFVGTTRGEWVVRASSLNEAITPTNISAKPSTRYGSAAVAPVTAGNATVFVQRAGRKLRELAYVFEIDGFRAPDLTLLAEHITRPDGVTAMAYQEQPQAVIWQVRGDGVLLGLTYERDQSVVAWHRHELGGHSDSGATAIPIVESVACVSAPDATRDELYLVVKRYINGGTKRYIEYMTKLWDGDDDMEDAFFLDCGFTQTSATATTLTGLWHLEGQTVQAYIDGKKHTDITIANGVAQFDKTGLTRTVGFAYNSDGQNMPVEGGAQDGSAQGKTKRIPRLGLWLKDTLGLKIGPDADHLTEIIERKWGDDYGAATGLFTGVVRKRIEGRYDRTGQVYWRADGPYPATVLAIMPQFEVADES